MEHTHHDIQELFAVIQVESTVFTLHYCKLLRKLGRNHIKETGATYFVRSFPKKGLL